MLINLYNAIDGSPFGDKVTKTKPLIKKGKEQTKKKKYRVCNRPIGCYW